MYSMYQLSPVSVRPQVRPTKDHQAIIETRVLNILATLETQTEVLDQQSHLAMELIESLDIFFAYGLLSGDRCYWSFVREFLPKMDREHLALEWKVRTPRRLSLAWLKDSLNRRSLHFQMLAFRDAKRILARFYHENACWRNPALTESIINAFEKIENVEFCFQSPSSMNQAVLTAVPVESPSHPPPSHPRRKKKTLTATPVREVDDTPVARVVPPPPSSANNKITTDEDFSLKSLLRDRKHRMNQRQGIYKGAHPDAQDIPSDHIPADPKMEPPSFTEALNKTLSQVHLNRLAEEPKPFDRLLDCDKSNGEVHAVREKIVGELEISSNDAIHLGLQVFDGDERPIRVFHVYENHASGTPISRILMLTNRNAYVLSREDVVEEASSSFFAPSTSNGFRAKYTYKVHATIAYANIRTIELSNDAQVIQLRARENRSFAVDDEAKDSDFISLCAADKQLGDAIGHALHEQVAEFNEVALFVESTMAHLILDKFLLKELSMPQVKVQFTSLVYWRESATGTNTDKLSHASYLYYRTVYPKSWLKPTGNWQQSYFALDGRQVIQFSDSTCKFGERIIKLTPGVETEEVRCEQPHVFELRVKDDPEGCLQLAAPSREELHKWLQLLSVALCSQETTNDSVACLAVVTETHIVVAQEGARCAHDGFMRALVSHPLSEITDAIVVRPSIDAVNRNENHTLVLRVGPVLEWLFFRSEGELNRLIQLLTGYPIPICNNAQEHSEPRLVSLILSQASKISDLWDSQRYMEE